MIAIQPIVFPMKGTATKLKITVMNFSTEDTTCVTHNQLFTEEEDLCHTWQYQLTVQQFDDWAKDNVFIENLVLADKNITRATI